MVQELGEWFHVVDRRGAAVVAGLGRGERVHAVARGEHEEPVGPEGGERVLHAVELRGSEDGGPPVECEGAGGPMIERSPAWLPLIWTPRDIGAS